MMLRSIHTGARAGVVSAIVGRLESLRSDLKLQWQRSGVHHFIIDDLLPQSVALAAFESFPAAGQMITHKNLGEHKLFANPAWAESPLLSEIVYAFHESSVATRIAEIVGAETLLTDPSLSVSGLTLMHRDTFVHPHLDASHDADERNYRVLSLLYCVTPDWRLCDGGHLELWHDGPDAPQTTILAKFNRLVVLATDQNSWNSVSPVTSRRDRCSISNCYFSPRSLTGQYYSHPTTFRGRPEQKLLDLVLRAEFSARSLLRRRSVTPPVVGASIEKRR